MSTVFEKPAEWFTGLPAQFPPEGVAPAMAFLAHESCELNGEIIICGGGQAKRLAIYESQGIASTDLTPEFIAENLAQLMDLHDAELMEVHIAMGQHGPD
jgi:hypothetical protein